MNREEAKQALDRLFDRCEEIDPESGYRMLDDIFALRDYIDHENKAKWELVYHDDHPSYYAHYVTARCSKCGAWFWGSAVVPGDHTEKYGAKLWSGFCTNYNENTKKQFEWLAIDSARDRIKELPKYCTECGAKMEGEA